MIFAIAVLAVSAAPALAFLVLILRMDRREPEPLGLVLRVIGLGAASCVVAALVERALGGAPLFHAPGLPGAAASSFIQIAPVEELCKLAVVLLFVWKSPSFNEENDGIVYVGASAIGFALLENILYVAGKGIGTGLLRAFSSIPLHVFTGVIMGMFVGRAKLAPAGARRILLLLAGFALAWLFHGLYDTFALSGSAVALLLLPLIVGVSSFGIVVLRRGRQASLARWGGAAPAAADEPSPTAVAPAVVEPRARVGAHPHAPAWMAVIARVLLAASAGFWLLLVIGVTAAKSPGPPRDVATAILGGLVITFIPGSLGVLLEIAYRRRRRAARRV